MPKSPKGKVIVNRVTLQLSVTCSQTMYNALRVISIHNLPFELKCETDRLMTLIRDENSHEEFRLTESLEIIQRLKQKLFVLEEKINQRIEDLANDLQED